MLVRRLGADPAARNVRGQTALHLVCSGFRYWPQWISYDEEGETIALRRGIIGLLLDRGLDARVADEDGRTALDLAELHKADGIAEFLQARLAARAEGGALEEVEVADELEDLVASRLEQDIIWQSAAEKQSKWNRGIVRRRRTI
ncbi:hypothetical protein F5B20DRAFT_550365 [Whalleya microplaca]|nr:hypothetical protein F5B20DRAFT_550365 [Whalleya microplaca]